jgi:hypothetical protein
MAITGYHKKNQGARRKIMGSMVAPKQFSAPGVLLSPDKQQAVVQQAQALPQQPLNPNLMMNMSQVPMYSAPNATPSPILPGVSNNPNQPNPLQYNRPGGHGGGMMPPLGIGVRRVQFGSGN